MINKDKFSNIDKSCKNFCCTKIENFSVTLGSNKILDNVNLHIHCGELTSLIGPNGAGKSTLLKALLGEIKHEGSLKFLGTNDSTFHQPIIGYVPQYLTFDSNSPISVLDLFTSCKSPRPSIFKPKKKIRNETFKEIGREFNVTDNAVRKWCDYFNLPRRQGDIDNYNDSEWENI